MVRTLATTGVLRKQVNLRKIRRKGAAPKVETERGGVGRSVSNKRPRRRSDMSFIEQERPASHQEAGTGKVDYLATVSQGGRLKQRQRIEPQHSFSKAPRSVIIIGDLNWDEEEALTFLQSSA